MKNDNAKSSKNYLKIGSNPDCKRLTLKDVTSKGTGGKEEKITVSELRKDIEPWLTALFQSERLNLLVGSGLTISMENLATGNHTKFMEPATFDVFSN